MSPRTTTAALLALLSPGPLCAATFQVPSTVATIAAALDSSASGDTVLVSCGTYLEHGLSLPNGVTLRSATSDPDCVTIDGGGLGRVLDGLDLDGSARLEGITITGGAAGPGGGEESAGGGLRLRSSDPVISKCRFTGNVAKFGGALGLFDSSPTIDECEFLSNQAMENDWAAGGAIYGVTSAAELTDCTISGNTAFAVAVPGDGGGIFVDECGLEITDCTFSQNSAGIGGGAFYSFRRDRSVLTRCTFTGNSTLAGGAAYVEVALARFVDCDFDGNQAQSGGAIFFDFNSSSTVEGCTFTGNEANPYSGGAIELGRSDLVLRDCAFDTNTAVLDGGAVAARGDAELTVEDCLFTDNAAGVAGGVLRATDDAQVDFLGCEILFSSAAAGGSLRCEGQAVVTADRTLLALGTAGAAVDCAGSASAAFSCSNVFGNAGGDWVGCLAGQEGANGNLGLDPELCDPAGDDYTVTLPTSPCLPENNPCGERIGLFDGGCGCPPSATIWVPADHATIGDALATASPGDVIGICDGDYPESITVVEGVHVVGVRSDLARVSWGGGTVVVATEIVDSTVVQGLGLDGLGAAPQVVLAESLSTGLHLRNSAVTGGATYGVLNGPDSWIRVGGALEFANDLFGNGGATPVDLRNENTSADSLDALLNYWGTTSYDVILERIEGPVRSCPITDVTHTKTLCAPISALGVPPTGPGVTRLTFGPNPFRSESRISLAVPDPGGTVLLTIHDVRGRRVRTLVAGRPPGPLTVTWGARDDRGRRVAPGIYFLRLEAGEARETHKLVHLR